MICAPTRRRTRPLRDSKKRLIRLPHPADAGAHDPRVPGTASDLIVQALRARKLPVEYMGRPARATRSHRETQIALFSRVARSSRAT
jgi:hypothetical protein